MAKIAAPIDDMYFCEECGSTGEGGEMEYGDGKREHFRKFPEVVTRPLALMCFGKFKRKEKE